MEPQTSPMNRSGGNPQDLDLKTLLTVLEERAKEQDGGECTILRVATGWKVKFDKQDLSFRSDIDEWPVFPSLAEAILNVLATDR